MKHTLEEIEKMLAEAKEPDMRWRVISDLVEEVKLLELKCHVAEIQFDTIKKGFLELEEENKRLREALNEIELEFNYSSALADIIRKALEGE